MKYYILLNSTNLQEIGRYIQTVGSIDKNGEDIKGINSRVHLSEFKFPDFVPNLQFGLEIKAKLTDVISTSNLNAKGFLINPKTKELFQEIKIIQHDFFSAKVIKNDTEYNYFWLHLVNDNFVGIDFSKSIFYETDIFASKIKEVKILNFDDYIKKCKEINFLNRITISELVLTDEFISEKIDLFFFPYIHEFVIASETLINLIIKNKISGFAWKNATFLK